MFHEIKYMNRYALIIAKDYWGTIKGVETGMKFAHFLRDHKIVCEQNIEYLLQESVNANSVISSLKDIVSKLSIDNTIVYVYMIGHGNEIRDSNGDEADGLDEVYQLPDGNVADDTISDIILSSNACDTSLLVLVSDHCSSGTMIDATIENKGVHWLNISSSQSFEDSYTSGDGNIMTACLMNLLRKSNLNSYKVSAIIPDLSEEMKSSFIGDLQHPCISVSDPSVMTKYPFSPLHITQ